jgi:hypothetical protein
VSWLLRAWQHFRYGCDWKWQHNEPTFVKTAPYGMQKPMWIGRYQCSWCRDWSDGCARWEQRSREVERDAIELCEDEYLADVRNGRA